MYRTRLLKFQNQNNSGRNIIVDKIRAARENYYRTLNYNKMWRPEQMWQNLKIWLQPKNYLRSEIIFDDNIYSKPLDNANKFNKYFIDRRRRRHSIENREGRSEAKLWTSSTLDKIPELRLLDMKSLKCWVKSLQNTAQEEEGVTTQTIKGSIDEIFRYYQRFVCLRWDSWLVEIFAVDTCG